MNAITTVAANDDSAITAPAIIEPASIMSKIIELASTPGINTEMVDRLIAWHEREQARQREDIAEAARLRATEARRAAQSEMLPILRTHPNTSTNSRYAPLDVIDPIIRPIYTKHGFSMDFDSEPIEGGVRVICEVSHDAGHTITRRLEGALDIAGPRGQANKTPIQALVSATTYLRRTLTCMVWNLAMFTEDNDGNRQRPAANDTGEVVGRPAVDLLYRLIADVAFDPLAIEANERGFLDSFGFRDLRSIKDIPPGEFARLKNALLDKKNQRAQRAALNSKSGAAA